MSSCHRYKQSTTFTSNRLPWMSTLAIGRRKPGRPCAGGLGRDTVRLATWQGGTFMRTVNKLIGLGGLLLCFSVAHCDKPTTGNTDMGTADLPSGFGISGIAPATGPNSGGTAITISGNGFQSGATVTVSGVACTSVTVVNPTSITCTTPAKALTCGPAAIVVTNPDSQTTMRSDLFAYQSGTLGFAAMTP